MNLTNEMLREVMTPEQMDDYKECRFAGCQGGTRMPDADGSYDLILCGMCY